MSASEATIEQATDKVLELLCRRSSDRNRPVARRVAVAVLALAEEPATGCEHDAQIMLAIRQLKENPWDTITLTYDAGEWGVELHEDAVRTAEIEPGESLLDRLNAAIQYTMTGDVSLLRS